MTYLDHAAATPLRPEALEAMTSVLGSAFGNPSGVHGEARRAKALLEEARERVAVMFGAESPLDVVFTGGGTEAVNLAVKGSVGATGSRPGVVASAIEHEAVLASVRALGRLGHPTTLVGVGPSGTVEPEDVAAAVTEETGLVSVMAANNETGVVQAVVKVAAAARDASPDVVVHSDAVQAATLGHVTLGSLGVDVISISAHKAGGPKGIGAVVLRHGIDLSPVVDGGGQELGRRSGTQDVAGIVGMAAALEAAARDRKTFTATVGGERDAFERALRARLPSIQITGEAAERLPQHSHVRFPGVDAETLLIRLDGIGVSASSGSACHSGALTPSHVLLAMGMSEEEARECVRFSFGWTTARGEGEAAAAAVAACVEALT